MSTDRTGYKFARGRNSGLRKKGQRPTAQSVGHSEEPSCDMTTPCVAVASANAVSPAVSLPVSPASSREQPKIETQGSQRSGQSGSQPISAKPNCYACKYRGEVPGSAHSSCHHPAFAEAHNNPLLGLLSMLVSVGRLPAVSLSSEACKVVGDPCGIRSGWFQHPMNFDPVWLKSCTGYEAMP